MHVMLSNLKVVHDSFLKTDSFAILYSNSTNKTAYDYFPILHLVLFKQPRYYSNQMRCCATNKEDNAILIFAKSIFAVEL